MTKSIRLSPQHGVNPSLMQCFYCGEDYGVALAGLLPGDKPAPRRGVWNMEPCPKCADFMRQGVICIGVDESKTTDPKAPYRDGNWCVVTTEAIQRIVTPASLADEIVRRRVAFLPTDAWDKIGLPKAGKSGAYHGNGKGGYDRNASKAD